jgi:uncharacterized phage protein gp47/JayE
MPVPITNLSELDAASVADNLAEITQRIQERNPTIDIKRGVFHDLLLVLHSELSTQHQDGLQKYLDARSLKAIEANPELADDDIVDHVLSNYRITRRQGAAAGGEVTIVVSSPSTVTIAEDAVFTANGQIFIANTVFTAKSQASQVSSATDRLLVPLDDGNYAFNISVTAQEIGSAGEIAKDTLLVPSVVPNNYVTSYAASNFTGGAQLETNTELITRLQEGIAAKATSNRVNMQAMVREGFPATAATSIIGYGDPEQLRDQHSVLPLSLGGRVDWYVRSQTRLLTTTLSMIATLVTKNADGTGLWQVNFTKDTAPGFYEVASIRLPSSENVVGGFNIESDVRGNDLTGDGFIPDIQTVAEGAYSRFQTAVIQFTDTETDHTSLTVGDKKTYDVAVRIMPGIDSIHDFVASRDVRGVGADILVRAPVPCFTQVSLTLHNKNTSTAPDIGAIQTAVADEINSIGFNGRIYASKIHDIVHNLVDSETDVGFISILGRIRTPSGDQRYIQDDRVLIVPDLASDQTSFRTVQFYADAEDITVSISTEVPEAT